MIELTKIRKHSDIPTIQTKLFQSSYFFGDRKMAQMQIMHKNVQYYQPIANLNTKF